MNIPSAVLDLKSSDPSEKTLEILNLLAVEPNLSQRDIAHASGVSLGMVNLVLRRLARTGYLKVTNLDGRKMRYLLTAKGLTSKSNRAYQYVLRSIRAYNQLLGHVERVIAAQIAQNKTHFVIDGEGEIADLVSTVLRAKGDRIQFQFAKDRKSTRNVADEVVIQCNIDNRPVEGISVLETLISAYPPASRGGTL